VGALEAASGGTLFLDEVGELPLDLQPALLRVLERREVKPLGADGFRPVDVRVVAATNRDLRRDVNSGRFRADLYYRLAVLPVAMPALRERREDIPLLAGALMDDIAGGDPAVRQQLADRVSAEDIARYDWPGNVRELKNYIESCSVLAHTLPAGEEPGWFGMPAPGASQPMRDARKHWLAWFERQYVIDLMKRSGGNVSAAARAAGVDRAYLYRLMRRSGADE
jgi:transcriptional regulator with GAF, ATPase, and Fis domain